MGSNFLLLRKHMLVVGKREVMSSDNQNDAKF